jgi:plasmid stabilization system protein ParE
VIVSLAGPAQQELVEASQFYAREGGAALGEAFIAEFERCALLLAEKPMQGAPFHLDTRRFLMRRFPYCLFYVVQGDELRVLAIAHQRRRPGYWLGRR